MEATVRIFRPTVVAPDQAVPVNARLVSVGELSDDSMVGIDNYAGNGKSRFLLD
jgi:hypothetical protein